jgi:phytoene dehydrogenase-like protein
MSKINIKPHYDVVVIGAGIGGLTAAAMLSRIGYSVVVLDSASQAGGYLSGFQRKQFRFDTAVHWLNQCNPGGMVHTVFETIGSDYPRVTTQKRIKRYCGDHHDYLLTGDPDELKKQWQAEFPEDKNGIERFFKDARQLGEQMTKWGNNVRASETYRLSEKLQSLLTTIRFILPFIKHVRFSGEEGLKKGLRRYFKNEKLQDVFCTEPDLLSCLIPIGWAYFGDFQNPPQGGGQAFPEWLEYAIKFFGNDIFLNSKVTRILLDGKTARGVEIDCRGTKYEVSSHYVIAACDVETLYEKMLPPEVVPEKFKKKLHEAILYGSSLTVSIALDCKPSDLGFNEEMVNLSMQNISLKEQSGGDPAKAEVIILAPSFRDATMAPEGHGTITIFMPAEIGQHNFWNADINAEGGFVRGNAYEKLKEETAELLIRRVEEKIAPGLRSHVLFYNVATPITHLRYTGNRNGTIMGARPGKENMQAGVAHYRTPIKNLLLGGHWAELGGGIPIAVKAGFNAALLICKDERPEAFDAYVSYVNKKITAEELRQSPVFKSYDNSWIQEKTPAQLLAERRAPPKLK